MALLQTLLFYLFSIIRFLFIVLTYLIYYKDGFLNVDPVETTYDYVIVGSGTAGSLIAHRLATETNYTFLVIEAGSWGHDILEIPMMGPLLQGTIYDWQFETVPQKNACLAMKNNKCKLSQGKIFGGSSKMNNMIHVRGNISHYVQWFHGKYSEDYIKKQFNHIEQNIIYLDNMKFQSELANSMMEAANELGYNLLGEKFDIGFKNFKVTQKNGKRWDMSMNVPSKHILVNALVEKVLIKDKLCYGVVINKLGCKKELHARKSVILSAGTLNTPKILQLSGIGPTKLLNKLGIPLIKELPVGKNLQDHIGSGLDLVLINKTLSINAMTALNVLNYHQYFFNGQGPLTSPGCEVLGFLSTKHSKIPDTQFMVLPVGLTGDKGSSLKYNVGLDDAVWGNYYSKVLDKQAATIFALLLHPKSKGQVSIQSKNPFDPPLIDPQYLSKGEDVRILIDAMKLVSAFVNTRSMKEIGAYINPFTLPNCDNYAAFSDSYWECYVRHLTFTSYHPVGTCAMGLSDSTSVVDTSFKVIGIDSLYVSDASVLPTLPSANINAAVAMMANMFFEINIVNNNYKTDCKDVCYRNRMFELRRQTCDL